MFIAYFVLWLIFCGRFTPEIVIIGIIVSLVLDVLASRLIGFDAKKGTGRLLSIFKYFSYFCLLIKEIIKCCFKVICLVWNPSHEIKPQLLYFSPNIKSENKRVLLANSITLTPGTITVELDREQFRVHALDAQFLDGIEECDFIHILKGVEDKYGAR